MATTIYAPKIPLEVDKYNKFASITDTIENIRQNLKMIMLTNPGEKLMDPVFGWGIRKYVFQNIKYMDTAMMKDELLNLLKTQLKLYLPSVQVSNFTLEFIDNKIGVSVSYLYKNIVNDTITLDLG